MSRGIGLRQGDYRGQELGSALELVRRYQPSISPSWVANLVRYGSLLRIDAMGIEVQLVTSAVGHSQSLAQLRVT